MELLNPGIGLSFWTLLIFSILVFILRKFAWKPIVTALHQREKFIEESLEKAEKAKTELERLQESNTILLKEATKEKDTILQEAKKMKEEIVEGAKDEAQQEATKIKERALKEIEMTKNHMVGELRTELTLLAVDITEKVLLKSLSEKKEQKEMIEQLAEKATFN